MFRFILLLVGFAFGWSIEEWPTALIIGAIGAVIGHLIDSQNRNTPKAPASTSPPVSLHQQFIQLQSRVQRLEQEVQALRAGHVMAENSSTSNTAETTSTTIESIEPTISAPIEPVTPRAPLVTPLAQQPAPPSRPSRPDTASTPNIVDELFAKAKAWLLGGNTVVRVGILILFFGVGFLL